MEEFTNLELIEQFEYLTRMDLREDIAQAEGEESNYALLLNFQKEIKAELVKRLECK